jgi:hypothetical protein
MCVQDQCVCAPNCVGHACGPDGCNGSCGNCTANQTCDAAGQCVCVPSCGGRGCGDDGCSGSCGSCESGQSCTQFQCVWPSATFARDVYPLFQSMGCPSCHQGSAPPAGLNLSSQSTAYAALVNVAASQCTSRKRVVPGSPGTSYVINKLTGSGMCSGQRMPRGRTPLTSTQIDLVRAWIGGGANP